MAADPIWLCVESSRHQGQTKVGMDTWQREGNSWGLKKEATQEVPPPWEPTAYPSPFWHGASLFGYKMGGWVRAGDISRASLSLFFTDY